MPGMVLESFKKQNSYLFTLDSDRLSMDPCVRTKHRDWPPSWSSICPVLEHFAPGAQAVGKWRIKMDQTQGLTSILILHLPSLGTHCSRGTSCGQFYHQILNPDCGSVIQNVQVREKTNNLNLWINFKCIYTISSIYWWCGLIVKLWSKSWLLRCLGVNMKSLFQYSGQLEILSKLSHLVWIWSSSHLFEMQLQQCKWL